MHSTTLINFGLITLLTVSSASAAFCKRNSDAPLEDCCWRDDAAKNDQEGMHWGWQDVNLTGDMCSEAVKKTCGADCCQVCF